MTRSGRMLALLALVAPGAQPALAGSGAPPAAARHRAPAVALDRAFMIGFWTDNGDCGNVIEFARDGRFIAADGGTGVWSLDGNRLTMKGRETATIRIIPIDRDTINVVNADGSRGRSTRCAARDPGDAPVRGDVT